MRGPSTGKRVIAMVLSAAYLPVRGVWRFLANHLLGAPPRGSAVVLTYHAVRVVDLPRFQRQMQILCRNTATVFADDMGNSDGRDRVAVTFDDAFHSVFEHALPVLASCGIPATIFVPTAYMGAQPGWRLEDDPAGTLEPVASAEVLARADGARIKVGSHSASHPHLPQVDDAQLEAELVHSKAVLERLVRRSVVMISLPYGSYNPRVLGAALRAGYRFVFANVPTLSFGGSPLVGRVNTSPADWGVEYFLKYRGAYEWMAVAVPVKRALRALASRRRSEPLIR